MVEEEQTTEEPKLSMLDETKQVLENLKKEKEEITILKKEMETLKSDQMLSGTAGVHIKPEVKEETAIEYKDRVLAGNV